jgi:hypothetical protein
MPADVQVEQEQPQQEGVNWGAAEALLANKPADAAAESDDTPEETPAGDSLVEVRIKGKVVKMTAEAADAYQGFVRETRERDGRLGGELARLKESQARLEGKVEAVRTPRSAESAMPTPPPAKLAIDDFEEYHRQMLTYHGAMMLHQQAELEGKYQQAESSKTEAARAAAENERWVGTFYKEHDHLNKPHLRPVIQSVYQANAREIEELNQIGDADGARERLAELVDEQLVQIKQDGKEVSTNRKTPPRLEGAGTSGRRGSQEKQFAPTTAASWSAKKRAELRGSVKK